MTDRGESSSTSSRGAAGCLGRIGGALFFGIFLAAGLGFGAVLLWIVWDAVRVQAWTRVPCQVVSARIASDDNGTYAFVARYVYSVNGRTYEGSEVQKNYEGDGEYAKAYRLFLRFAPEGASPDAGDEIELTTAPRGAECSVNPDDPSEAVLVTGGWGMAPFLLIPLVFVIVGGAGVVGSLFRVGSNDAAQRRTLGSVSAMTNRVPTIVFGAFFLIGGIATVFVGRMAWRSLSSGDWIETPCRVLASRLITHSDSDGTTYRQDVLYAYVVDGRPYRSNSHDFMGGSSSGYDSNVAIVNRYPPGSAATCYVNPDDPTDAVLDRSMGWMWLIALIPLAFTAIGAGGLIWGRRGGRANWPTPPRVPRSTALIDLTESGPRRKGLGSVVEMNARQGLHGVTFDCGSGRITRLVAVLFAALFWNGILSVFIIEIVRGWTNGDGSIFLTLFMTPFVAVGLFLIGATAYSALALFNPRLSVTMPSSAPALGETVSLEWTWSGSFHRVQVLTVTLEGREVAEYRRGTDTSTDTHVFFRQVVTEVTRFPQPQRGDASVVIPADSMHSFRAPHNAIVWALVFHGQIPNWPDVKEEIVLDVRPLPVAEVVS